MAFLCFFLKKKKKIKVYAGGTPPSPVYIKKNKEKNKTRLKTKIKNKKLVSTTTKKL